MLPCPVEVGSFRDLVPCQRGIGERKTNNTRWPEVACALRLASGILLRACVPPGWLASHRLVSSCGEEEGATLMCEERQPRRAASARLHWQRDKHGRTAELRAERRRKQQQQRETPVNEGKNKGTDAASRSASTALVPHLKLSSGSRCRPYPRLAAVLDRHCSSLAAGMGATS
ncbi:hypothetical protein BDZ90DRAFT_162985 [Jaminaea rosea]|uniref:Uncharacterized protein n=1 Tax=Jaminaea rosea TaxID=1569628 RepID=A0A316USZ1_9BASI|nr:hypothetical protein BDZ90DRAFT_162985 [Jaminaea rosea]PWN28114.1 hypothetical protein BDZ90DRAFT_162985 [Jaminaea rosea]